ncbi:MAG: ribonuclease HII [Flavobacteriales bacterium]
MEREKKKELLFSKSGYTLEAGCDEAGRGCLAGPVVAAAVILRHPIPGLNDSKRLNEKQRKTLAEVIKSEALAYHIAFVDEKKIDEINILNASILGMHRALDGLNVRPEFLLIDGNRFKPYQNIPFEPIIKGDSLYQSIAAASILAKTTRDQFMEEAHEKHPKYGWNINKGYPTKAHVEAIKAHGFCNLHRKTFGINRQMTQGNLFE